MDLIIADDYYNIEVINNKISKFFYLMKKQDFYNGVYFPKCNNIHTFFLKDEIDIVGLDNKNVVIYKYQDVPKNKIIEIHNPKKNTNILVLPKNISKIIKINDILSLEGENII